MRKSITEVHTPYKVEVRYRTDHTRAPFGASQLSEQPVVFDIAEKTRGVAHGGIALIHQVVQPVGLVAALNSVPVLKLTFPYHESDHLLSIAYNFLCGGTSDMRLHPTSRFTLLRSRLLLHGFDPVVLRCQMVDPVVPLRPRSRLLLSTKNGTILLNRNRKNLSTQRVFPQCQKIKF